MKKKSRLTKIRVDEISLVDNPAVPGAEYVIAKRDESAISLLDLDELEVHLERDGKIFKANTGGDSVSVVREAFVDAIEKLRDVAEQMDAGSLAMLSTLMDFTLVQFDDPITKGSEDDEDEDEDSEDAEGDDDEESDENEDDTEAEGVNKNNGQLEEMVETIFGELVPVDADIEIQLEKNDSSGLSLVEQINLEIERRKVVTEETIKKRQENEIVASLGKLSNLIEGVNARIDGVSTKVNQACGKG